VTAGVVACGHAAVADAAAITLRRGGNAFDACVAAGFAGAVAEPCFTSLGGGGFLLAHTSAADDILFDFFVDFPGRGLPAVEREPHFLPVNVNFLAAEQVFHAGLGSVAVPGCFAGYLHVHDRLGRLPLGDVVAPAIALARDGVHVDATHAEVLQLLEPILLREEACAALFSRDGALLGEGDVLVNPDLASFLELLAMDRGRAEMLVRQLAGTGALVTGDDLDAYRVVEREPLRVEYRGHTVITNPPPSFGGALIARALSLDEQQDVAPWHSAAHLESAVDVMVAVDRERISGATKGTTQMTVADGDGNVASMTTSNGETSGDVIPGTGIVLNNMLGEDDLHPDGFHAGEPGARVPSMMAPTMVEDAAGNVVLALGSGGSKRIRTAIAQVITAAIAHRQPLDVAVEAPRLHWDGVVVQAEPGFPDTALAHLERRWSVNRWPRRNLYFGGVHAVRPGVAAHGDPRRGGTARRVDADSSPPP
jgi:gamma-glutamyltranspeptidase/glutathione hydrolase